MYRNQIAELNRLNETHTVLDAKIATLLEERDEVRQRMTAFGVRFDEHLKEVV